MLIGAGILAVAAGTVLVLACLVLGTPVGLRRAQPGTTYRVRTASHRVPAVRLPAPALRLIREPVLARMADLLEYADRVLGEHGIPYWISCGTLLGAVRHGGFIPWDDDIDVQVMLADRQRLLELSGRFARDGYRLLHAGGGLKLACDNFWRFPYIDLAVVDRVGETLKLCYPLARDGRWTFEKARQWPNECLPCNVVFPLTRVAFEDFSVAAPGETVAALEMMYGRDALTEVAASTFMPWIINHRTDSLLVKLGIIEG